MLWSRVHQPPTPPDLPRRFPSVHLTASTVSSGLVTTLLQPIETSMETLIDRYNINQFIYYLIWFSYYLRNKKEELFQSICSYFRSIKCILYLWAYWYIIRNIWSNVLNNLITKRRQSQVLNCLILTCSLLFYNQPGQLCVYVAGGGYLNLKPFHQHTFQYFNVQVFPTANPYLNTHFSMWACDIFFSFLLFFIYNIVVLVFVFISIISVSGNI